MRSDFNKIKGGNPLNNLLLGQHKTHAPLLQLERLIMFEDFVLKGLGMMMAVMETDDRFYQHYPNEKGRMKAFDAGAILNTAAFSLTKFYGDTPTALANMEDMLLVAADINAQFRSNSKGIYGSCAVVTVSLEQTDPGKNPESDVLMLFYPGRISSKSWDLRPSPHVRDSKFKFFALLQERGLISEKDIGMNGIDIGLQAQKLAQETQKLQKNTPKPSVPKLT